MGFFEGEFQGNEDFGRTPWGLWKISWKIRDVLMEGAVPNFLWLWDWIFLNFSLNSRWFLQGRKGFIGDVIKKKLYIYKIINIFIKIDHHQGLFLIIFNIKINIFGGSHPQDFAASLISDFWRVLISFSTQILRKFPKNFDSTWLWIFPKKIFQSLSLLWDLLGCLKKKKKKLNELHHIYILNFFVVLKHLIVGVNSVQLYK